MIRVEYRVLAVLSELAARDIERVVVAASVDFPVEEEFKWRLAPRQVRILPGVQLAPSPVFWAIRYPRCEESMRVSHCLGHIVCTVIGTFVLWVGLLANLLEMGLVTLCIDFVNQALQHLWEGIVVTEQHSLFFTILDLLVEEALK